MSSSATRLELSNLAQLDGVTIEFGDLTVLVGPQATGKSLALQVWKLLQDRGEIYSNLRAAGFKWSDDAGFVQHVLGQGWDTAWGADATVVSAGKRWTLRDLRNWKGKRVEQGRVFYIPAQRTLVLDNGWPRQFQQFSPDTPYVVRQFSQTLHAVIGGYAREMSGETASVLFPHGRRLKGPLKQKLNDAVFHGASLTLQSAAGMRWQLGLEFDQGKTKLGFMSWTAGQREVSPLLLGLYHLLPAGRIERRNEIDWVVIEEPEMGLHPRAILAVLLIVLDLVARGYKVVLSTHAPLVLDVLFAIRQLKELRGIEPAERVQQRLLRAFAVPKTKDMMEIAAKALERDYRVFALDYAVGNRVTSTDVSGLDPASEDAREAGWGGLTGLSSQVTSAAFDEFEVDARVAAN